MPLLAFKAFIALNLNHRCEFFFGVLLLFLFFSMIVRHALLEIFFLFCEIPISLTPSNVLSKLRE